MIALFPLCLETGVECTYPVPEGTSAGLQLLCSQVFGLLLIILMGALKGVTITIFAHHYAVSNILLICCVGVSCLLIMLFQGQYKRLAAEPDVDIIRL